jgi:hypothetical protein
MPLSGELRRNERVVLFPGACPMPKVTVKPAMWIYALVSSRLSRQTLDVFVSRETAEAELREILEDEPGWVNVLRVEPIQLDAQGTSVNYEGLANGGDSIPQNTC